MTALFSVKKELLPRFLGDLLQDEDGVSLADTYFMEVEDRDVVVDAHFMGVTQMYRTVGAPVVEFVFLHDIDRRVCLLIDVGKV